PDQVRGRLFRDHAPVAQPQAAFHSPSARQLWPSCLILGRLIGKIYQCRNHDFAPLPRPRNIRPEIVIDKLEYLLALAREKHFGRAAETCAVSQPSLSLGLKQLEEMLGVMLVQRGSRFVGLTSEGERALEWARRIVGDARAIRQDIKALKHGLN